MLLAAFLSAVLLSESQGVKFFEGSWENARKEAAKANLGILIDFSTEW